MISIIIIRYNVSDKIYDNTNRIIVTIQVHKKVY